MSITASPLEIDNTTWQKRLQSELDRYLDLLLTHVSPQQVILFGSFAQDHVHLWSDIDLVIVVDTKARFLDRTKEILRLLQPQVGLDVLVYTPEEFERLCRQRPFFQEEIMAKGKVLFERRD